MQNKKYAGSLIRHAITVIAGAVITSEPGTIEELLSTLFQNIASGDAQSMVGASIAIFAVLWSMWNKTEETTKQSVVKMIKK